MSDSYKEATYGEFQIGFGTKPAIVVVDFQQSFTDSKYPIGGFKHIHNAVEQTANLLDTARKYNIPVASCYTGYNSEKDMPYWKIGAVRDEFYLDHPGMELDNRIHKPDYDFVFSKSAPSIFFNTPLVTFLTKQCVDTVIVTGCTTSGCIRATVIDSFSWGYRTVVPEECCGDADERPHQDNLRDIGRRYADVTDRKTVENYLKEVM
ncbi:isochorismatase family protein [Alphaproteobacteria bacterium]|nr:isochorismatase family protein [Alphaproteobacteria bacterium]